MDTVEASYELPESFSKLKLSILASAPSREMLVVRRLGAVSVLPTTCGSPRS